MRSPEKTCIFYITNQSNPSGIDFLQKEQQHKLLILTNVMCLQLKNKFSENMV